MSSDFYVPVDKVKSLIEATEMEIQHGRYVYNVRGSSEYVVSVSLGIKPYGKYYVCIADAKTGVIDNGSSVWCSSIREVIRIAPKMVLEVILRNKGY